MTITLTAGAPATADTLLYRKLSAEALPDDTKVEILETPKGGIPSLPPKPDIPVDVKLDVVDLSPDALEHLKKFDKKLTEVQPSNPGQPIIPLYPMPGPSKISPGTQHLVDGFLARIRSITMQFHGLAQTPENVAKLNEALKQEGVSIDQLRVYKPRTANLPVNEQGLTIYDQFMQAYAVRWKSPKADIPGVDAKIPLADTEIKSQEFKLSPSGVVVSAPHVQPVPPKINAHAQRLVDNFIGQIRSIVSQFDGLEATEENKGKLASMLKEAGVHEDQLRIRDPRVPINPNAPVNAEGLTIYQQFLRAYLVNWKV